jgi:hypothetical protein
VRDRPALCGIRLRVRDISVARWSWPWTPVAQSQVKLGRQAIAAGGLVSNDSLGLPPVLAGPSRPSRRRRIVVAHLAVVLATAGVVALIQHHLDQPLISPAATLTSPGDTGLGAVAAFSPDGTTLATNDGDGSVYVWDVATRQHIATMAEPVPA